MAALAPAVVPLIGSAAPPALGGTAGAIVSAGLGTLASARARNRADKQAASARRQKAEQQIADINRRRALEERQARDDLKRAEARHRARFAAAGLLASRSADAVLEGLRLETEQKIADARHADHISIRNLHNRSGRQHGAGRKSAAAGLLDLK